MELPKLPNDPNKICKGCLKKMTEGYKKSFPEQSEKTISENVAMLIAMLTNEEFSNILRYSLLGVMAVFKNNDEELKTGNFKRYVGQMLEIGFKELKSN